MPGQPQVRQHSWLYLPGDDIPAAVVRIEQRMDGTGGWIVLHNVPASAPTQRSEHDGQDSAYAKAQRLRDWIDSLYHDQHNITGQWDIREREPH
ncbi:hypothetical protein [Verrucosispora sp. NA02020]|uniref:hypothetical protein n=1 Tax=Verrucosispora sp. NA02020 TaxID=2742132 RepID=UPI001590E295|nr:hypothetical protein [Verrucosispora sp. NA02020]QKW15394.1 hypothetical protein HUT12_23255 [Verrucosispora sp. NA02020]